ncbi:MAG: CpXC domain-containing protein [Anaerolineae bacterium]|jgi:hypothetical protein|nr:CpXC domain-containing protein [Anaerolineae bacterium]
MPPARTTIRCNQCGQPVPADVRTVIDVQSDPQGKALLMSGRLNMVQCPQCGFVNRIVAPLLYHDAEKQLLVAHVPGEVLRGQTEEKVIGDLMNDLTRSLPKEAFRAYMFNPKRTLTVQGLVDLVMQGDGITPEMLEQQKKRVELLQQLISAPSPDAMLALIQQHDSAIDSSFFQTMRLMAGRLVQEGRPDIASRMVVVQDMLLAHSTFGQALAQQQSDQEATVEEVAQRLQSLGEQATHDDFVALVVEYAADPERLQALVGLARPAFDATFFQKFALFIGQAAAADRPGLEKARDFVIKLTETIDEQLQQTVQRTAQFLQVLLNSPNPDDMLEANADLIDEDFMAVLTANIQEAERRRDAANLARLQAIYEKVVALLRSQMSPELSFLNDLMAAGDELEVDRLLSLNKGKFDETLLQTVAAVEQMLAAQGQRQALERLARIRNKLNSLF